MGKMAKSIFLSSPLDKSEGHLDKTTIIPKVDFKRKFCVFEDFKQGI